VIVVMDRVSRRNFSAAASFIDAIFFARISFQTHYMCHLRGQNCTKVGISPFVRFFNFDARPGCKILDDFNFYGPITKRACKNFSLYPPNIF
jgi:hypothetical protein